MQNQNRIALIYGYLICLVAVISFIITTGGLIQALIDAGHPFQSKEFVYQTSSLTSFDNYVLEKRQRSGMDSVQRLMVADTTTLRRMYEAEIGDLIQKANHRIRKEVIVNSSLLLLSVSLFVFHWNWLRRLAKNS
jgi:hypothetical protein